MLNPALEDHAGGDLGYLNSLFNGLLCFGQDQLQILEKKIISGVLAWRGGLLWGHTGYNIYIYIYIYLLLAKWEVRMASYRLSFFLPCMAHENKEGKKRGSITCCMD